MSIHEPLRLLRIPHETSNVCFGRGTSSSYLCQTEESKQARERTQGIFNNGDMSTVEGLEDKDLNEQHRDIMTPWLYTAGNADVTVINGLSDVMREWYGVLDCDAEIINRCLELIHISSLMLVDTKTATPTRRGIPAAHTVFGVTHTVHSAKSMTIKGIKELARLRNAKCMRVLLDEIVRKLFTSTEKDMLVAPSVEDHIEALHSRSGSIILLAKNLMEAASSIPRYKIPRVDRLIDLLARLNALRDDYANLVALTTSPKHAGTRNLESKIQSFYMALDEGKYSLLLVHASNILPSDKELLLNDVIMQRRNTGRFKAEHKPLVLEILRGCGSFEFVIKLIRDLQAEIMHALNDVEVECESFSLDGGVDGREREGESERSGGMKRGTEAEMAGQVGSDIDVNGFRLLVQHLSV